MERPEAEHITEQEAQELLKMMEKMQKSLLQVELPSATNLAPQTPIYTILRCQVVNDPLATILARLQPNPPSCNDSPANGSIA
jgi:hypothetical protein